MALAKTDVGIWVSANTIGTTAFTTGSFTPPDNSLLVIACGTMRDSGTNTTLGRPTITDSLGTPLTYNQVDFTNLTPFFSTQMTVWTAAVGTGASMTITVDDPNNFDMFGYQVCVFAFTGYDTSTPVAGTIDTGTTDIGDGAHSLTLTSAPASGDYSLIFLHLDCTATNANPTLDTGWTEAFDNGTSGGGGTLVGLHRTSSTSTTAAVTDVYTGGGSFFKGSMLALIVRAAGSVPPPSFVTASAGATDATGPWSYTTTAPTEAGNVYIVQVLQDGTLASPAIDSVTNAENLAGTDNTLTYIGEFDVGNPVAASQHLWIGRALNTSAMVITGSNSGGDDVYVRVYEFTDVNAGTTLAAVIENGTAGSTVNSAGTSATASDAGVTTLGADRLALNFVAVNDDNAISAFTGETGGDWTLAVTPYASATGTDGAIALQIASIASAGTIDGGTGSIVDSDAWGTVGFALIGAGAAARTIEATAGSYALTGAAATLLEGRLLSANAGAYAVTGAAATLVFGRTLSADPGTYAVTGADATLLEGRVLSADPGSYAITGTDSALLEGRLLSADPGSYAVTGADANLGIGRALLADPGSYTITGSAASLLADSVLSVDPGSYAIAGSAAQLLGGRALLADPGVYAVTGGQATLLRGLVIQLDAGTYAVTGQAAELLTVSSYLLSADPGAYSVTGTAAATLAARLLATDAGVFAVTGSQATLVTARVLSLDNGVYAITGQDAALAAGKVLSADPGAYLITGAAAELVFQGVGAFVLTADPGSYAVSGADGSLTAGYLLVADDGAYLITGANATLLAARMLAANPGAYLVTGNAATLTVTGAVTGPGIVIGGDTTLVHVTGGDLVLAAVTGGHMSSDNTKVSGGTTGRSRALGGDRTTAYASSGDRRSDP